MDRTKVQAFIICGIMSALAGLYISAYSKSGSPIIGDSYSQNSINAAVIGGASLMGGKSSAIGCVAAVLIIGIVGNILNLMHVSAIVYEQGLKLHDDRHGTRQDGRVALLLFRKIPLFLLF